MRLSRAFRLVAVTLSTLLATHSVRAQARETTYFAFQVTKPVMQAPGSGTPTYPLILKSQRIEGEVLAMFVVDTLGRAELQSFKVLRSSHELFTAAVLSSLPDMRFIPAEVRGVKVRQLVQQPFVFAVSGAAPGGAASQALPDPRVPPGARGLLSAIGTGKPAPSPPVGTVEGWSFSSETTVDSGGTTQKRVSSQRFQTINDKMRVELHSASARPELAGSVMLFDLAEHTSTLVFPQRRSATVTGAFAAGMVPMPLRLDVLGTPKVSVQNLGAGEDILGHRTQRYRVSTSFVLRVTMGAHSCSRSTNSEAETWTTTDADIHPTLQEMSMHMLDFQSIPGDAIEKLAALRADRVKGFTLRSVSKQSTSGPDGRARTVTSSMQVTELARGPIEQAAFAIPEGYMTTDMREQFARLRAVEDSLGLPHPDATALGAPADSMLWRSLSERFCDPPPAKK
jgi:TonB family protein